MTDVLQCVTLNLMVRIRKLIWDNWNIEHIKKHKVSIQEVEETCHSGNKPFKTYKKRLIILGKTREGRLLTVVLAPVENGKYYVVTARDTSKKERELLR